MSRTNPRIAIVCMVRDSYEYLAEFISYHEILADHIFFIDHRSKKDLRALLLPNISVLRSNHYIFFQTECVNKAIEHFAVASNYDWLFTLDIDEFLPFSSREEIEHFCKQNRTRRVLHFFWRNGYGAASKEDVGSSLVDYEDLYFFRTESVYPKSCINLRVVKSNFFVTSGAHYVCYRQLRWYLRDRKLRLKRLIRSHAAKLPLYHIPAFDRAQLTNKIANIVEQRKYNSNILGRAGRLPIKYVRDFRDASDDEWRWYIANFRLKDPSVIHKNVSEEDYERCNIFDRLDKEKCLSLRNYIDTLPKANCVDQRLADKQYMAWKTNEHDIEANLNWFSVSSENEIECIDLERMREMGGGDHRRLAE